MNSEYQPDETMNSLMKPDQKPRRSKDRVGVSVLIFLYPFHFRLNAGSSVKRLQNTLVVHYYIFYYVTFVMLCYSCDLITIFSTAFCYATSVTLVMSFYKKNAPGGGLIRVDLIRFPGSIPGGRQMCAS